MKKLTDLTLKLLEEKYTKEFTIIDGLNQHPEGLTFKEWAKKVYDLDVDDS